MAFAPPVTSLGELPPGPSRMSGCHPGIVTSRNRELSRGRTQKRPVTHRFGLFAVRHRLRAGLTGKRFGSRLCMVELFPAAFSSGGPRSFETPVRLVTESGSPHASRVVRASQPSPRGRDSHPLCTTAASFPRRVPVAPVRGNSIGSNARVVLCANAEGLTGRASVEPDERLSTHPALRAGTTLGFTKRVMSPPRVPVGAGDRPLPFSKGRPTSCPVSMTAARASGTAD